MNFKFLFLLFLVLSCGVKGDPVPPASSKIPSLLENYEDIQVDQSLKETRKR